MPNEDRAGHLYWSLIEPYWLTLNETWDLGSSSFLAQLRKVPLKVRHVYSAHWCQSEVFNGGLYQFFFNTTGLLAPDALDGFRGIGLQEWSEVLDEAMRYFGTPYPRERKLRLVKLPEARSRNREDWDPFLALDERFNKWADEEHDRWELAADSYAAST
ncbi:MAG: DUF4375 domain-containing protein [Planctomycetaceae bacterium]